MSWEQYKSKVPEGQSSEWRVEKYVVAEDSPGLWIFNLKSHGREVPPGEYTRLKMGGTVVMTDTPAEIRDLYGLKRQAKGHVLINGLGLGIATVICLENEKVDHVTVIEISEDVIRLVGVYLKLIYKDKLTIVHADAFEYIPPKGVRYGAVWHDIWDNICTDNLLEMHKLHRKYGRRTDWQGSWCREELEYRKKQERSYW